MVWHSRPLLRITKVVVNEQRYVLELSHQFLILQLLLHLSCISSSTPPLVRAIIYFKIDVPFSFVSTPLPCIQSIFLQFANLSALIFKIQTPSISLKNNLKVSGVWSAEEVCTKPSSRSSWGKINWWDAGIGIGNVNLIVSLGQIFELARLPWVHWRVG